jgi:hypothetical protein
MGGCAFVQMKKWAPRTFPERNNPEIYKSQKYVKIPNVKIPEIPFLELVLPDRQG